jgi:hypothetical protein
MIELTLDATGLARSRFAVSPLAEVAATLLLPWGPQPSPGAAPWVARARRVLRRARLPLLSALALDGPGYVPDFLVRHTPPGRVLAELEALHGGRPLNGLAGTELPGEVRRAMARGGAHVARQAADELRRFWDLAFARTGKPPRPFSTRRSTDAPAYWPGRERPSSSAPSTPASGGRTGRSTSTAVYASSCPTCLWWS